MAMKNVELFMCACVWCTGMTGNICALCASQTMYIFGGYVMEYEFCGLACDFFGHPTPYNNKFSNRQLSKSL